jgi:hypothetical protein
MANATLSHRYLIFTPVVETLAIPDGLIFLSHNLVINGTLTLLGSAELLVI